MSKLMRVSASSISDMVATVRVPDHVTPEQLMRWYKDNGASGEFEDDNAFGGWEWGEAYPLDARQSRMVADPHDLTDADFHPQGDDK